MTSAREEMDSDATGPEPSFDDQLQAFVGQAIDTAQMSLDPVNVPMVRQWCQAMGDDNPIYLDEDIARASGHQGTVAPPTMLQAWVMRPYGAPPMVDGPNAYSEMTALVQAAGFTSVVASNCEQTYDRYVRPGDRLTMRTAIDSISSEKQTALGAGHFITTRQDYFDADDERVGSMLFRILRFRPNAKTPAAPPPTTAPPTTAPPTTAPPTTAQPAGEPRPLRPRPSVTHDQTFWFEGLRAGKLLIQKCDECGALRHPPGPMCRSCRSLRWSTVEASGRGVIHSFVVVHYPQIPSIDYPNQVVLVELEEGVRIVANTVDTTRDRLRIGAEVTLRVQRCDDDLSLPFFEVAK